VTDHDAPARRSDLGVMVGTSKRAITQAYRDAKQQQENDEAIAEIQDLLWR
jgi:hypothetical protein